MSNVKIGFGQCPQLSGDKPFLGVQLVCHSHGLSLKGANMQCEDFAILELSEEDVDNLIAFLNNAKSGKFEKMEATNKSDWVDNSMLYD